MSSANSPLAIIGDALAAALLAALLALPLLGFRLLDSAQGLSLGYRFELVVYAALAVFVGRLAVRIIAPRLSLPRLRFSHDADKTERRMGYALVGFAALLPMLPLVDRNLLDIATLVLIYVMLGTGLNIVVGLAGLLDLGYVAFYAVGAYSYAILSQHFGLSFWICLPLAGLLAASFGILLGFPVLRLRGDYLAIVTLGFGEIIRIIINNWQSLTGGPIGIAQIARPSLFGLTFQPGGGAGTFAGFFGIAFSPLQRIVFLYYLALALVLATVFFVKRIRRLPLGRAWEALREDEIACRSLGLNPTTIKLSAFALGATCAGFAGSFFATRQGFISPESFTFIESAIILAIVVLGGMGSQLGIVLAALVLVGLPEWFRDLEQYRMLAFGSAMVLIMLWRPQGLLSRRAPTVTMGSAAMTALLEVDGLTMRFGGLTAVDKLAFRAQAGEITAVIGPNGAGKTTMFNCLTGFYPATSGSMRLNRPDGSAFQLERMPGHRIARDAHIVRTFQNIRLFAGMTALENLIVAQHVQLMRASLFSVAGLFGLKSYRKAEQEAVARARHWLDRFGLTACANETAGSLAYGAQRRLEIARAMCADPVLLCLDEPAAGLNPREGAELSQLLLDIRRETGIAILLIEHDMSVVMRISDHIVVLDHGACIATGTPAEIRSNPKVLSAYLGEDAA